MRTIKTFCAAALLAGVAGAADMPLKAHSLTQLEQRLADIDAELEKLAQPGLRSGVGSVGYRTRSHARADTREWIQIELDGEHEIDQIVLVPTIWRDTKEGFKADGFPLEFQLTAGTETKTNRVAGFTEADHLLPRIAPLVISCPVTTASWVRVEASILSPRAWDGRHTLQFAEIFVFNGTENVALQQPVVTSSEEQREDDPWQRKFLTDGLVPYLMDAAQGEQSLAFVSEPSATENPILTIDLQCAHPINGIHLHTTDLSDTIPQSTPAGFGIPRHMVIDGANRPDFSDAVRLTEYRQETIFDTGPMIALRFPETLCRYIRIVATDPYIGSTPGPAGKGPQIGFAEIEIVSNGRNVAQGKPVTANLPPQDVSRHLSTLTDGRNLYGNILPAPTWMEQLARRHDLETERPVIEAELNRRYARQKINLYRLGWLAVLLGACIVSVVLIDRMIRQRAIYRTRERIAADLHDELGANLHAIGMLSGIAESSVDNHGDLVETVRRIRELTLRTGDATRLCTNMLESNGLCEDLVEEMKRASDRLLADLEHDISIQGEEELSTLSSRRRIDLFLFYKECLTNIIRHSEATRAATRLSADEKTILLEISDNGQGTKDIPLSLKRRARLMRAQVHAEPLLQGGTIITLQLRTRRWRLRTRRKI